MKLLIKMVLLGAGSLACMLAFSVMALINFWMAIPLILLMFVLLYCFVKTFGEILAE